MSQHKKTPCNVSRSEFRQNARPMTLTITDSTGKQITKTLEVKEFSTGSLGWNLSEKMEFAVGGKMVKCQVGMNATIANSKELPQDEATAGAA
jgi:hypothetical protein